MGDSFNKNKKLKKGKNFVGSPSFLSFSFLSFFSSKKKKKTHSPLPPPPQTPPPLLLTKKPNERESGARWSRVARRVRRPARMAQHRFLPSFLSPNSRARPKHKKIRLSQLCHSSRCSNSANLFFANRSHEWIISKHLQRQSTHNCVRPIRTPLHVPFCSSFKWNEKFTVRFRNIPIFCLFRKGVDCAKISTWGRWLSLELNSRNKQSVTWPTDSHWSRFVSPHRRQNRARSDTPNQDKRNAKLKQQTH